MLNSPVRGLESAASSPASSVEVESTKLSRIKQEQTPDGANHLDLYLRSESPDRHDWVLYIRATPRADVHFAKLILRLSKVFAAQDCEIKMVADGQRLELGGLTKLVEREASLDYRSAIPYASLLSAAQSSRVVAKVCDAEIELSESHIEILRELVIRIREEQAWDDEPTAPSEDTLPGTIQL